MPFGYTANFLFLFHTLRFFHTHRFTIKATSITEHFVTWRFGYTSSAYQVELGFVQTPQTAKISTFARSLLPFSVTLVFTDHLPQAVDWTPGPLISLPEAPFKESKVSNPATQDFIHMR